MDGFSDPGFLGGAAGPGPSGTGDTVAPGPYTDAMAQLAAGVAVLTVREERDDIGGTVSAFTSVSADPPTVLVSLDADGYLNEVVGRQGAFAVSVLSAQQRALAGRFSAEGRPSARLLLAEEAHHRGAATGALVLDGALAALECRVVGRAEVADHAVYYAEVTALPDVHGSAAGGASGGAGSGPLVRFGRRYRTLG